MYTPQQAQQLAATRTYMRKAADHAYYLGDSISAMQYDMEALNAEKSLTKHGYDPETGRPR